MCRPRLDYAARFRGLSGQLSAGNYQAGIVIEKSGLMKDTVALCVCEEWPATRKVAVTCGASTGFATKLAGHLAGKLAGNFAGIKRATGELGSNVAVISVPWQYRRAS